MIGKPFNVVAITERIDHYQKLAKVIQFNVAFEIQRSSPYLSQGVRHMQESVEQLVKIKEDVTRSKQGVEHLKHKIADNTRQALRLLDKKRILEETKRVLIRDLVQHKESLAEIKRLVKEAEFVKAIDLCDESIRRTKEFDMLSLTSQLTLTNQLRERFEMIRNVRLVNQMQHTMSNIFKKQSMFD